MNPKFQQFREDTWKSKVPLNFFIPLLDFPIQNHWIHCHDCVTSEPPMLEVEERGKS